VILADTSVWVDHLRSIDDRLAARLNDGRILTHPIVIGELALGRLAQRQTILDLLEALPKASTASDAEVMRLIKTRGLAGRGIGWVDAHLLAATRITPDTSLWTRDKRLARLADDLGVAAEGPG
jgi:predicted nucleic acid-binding protein